MGGLGEEADFDVFFTIKQRAEDTDRYAVFLEPGYKEEDTAIWNIPPEVTRGMIGSYVFSVNVTNNLDQSLTVTMGTITVVKGVYYGE